MRRLVALLVVGVVPLGLAACSSDEDAGMDMSATTTGSSADGNAAVFNDADVTFAQSMIPHHEQAVEMAEIALEPAAEASPEVVDLATRIQQAQDPEIELMTGWLAEWGQPVEMNMSAGDDMASMEGMMSDGEMGALAAARGPAFDRLWMEMMIAHHEGAIATAETEQGAGSNPDAIDLAGQIIAAQQAEIGEMTTLLAG